MPAKTEDGWRAKPQEQGLIVMAENSERMPERQDDWEPPTLHDLIEEFRKQREKRTPSRSNLPVNEEENPCPR